MRRLKNKVAISIPAMSRFKNGTSRSISISRAHLNLAEVRLETGQNRPATKRRRPRSCTAFLLIMISSVLLPGCQSDEGRVYPIKGKVVFEDGSPAKFGIIEFRSDTPMPITARGKINKDGTFRVRATGKPWGLTKGSHHCVIVQVIGVSRGQPKIAHNHGLEVADKYRDYKTSDLMVEVTPDGENEFTLQVESK